jgi:hypothetical protein
MKAQLSQPSSFRAGFIDLNTFLTERAPRIQTPRFPTALTGIPKTGNAVNRVSQPADFDDWTTEVFRRFSTRFRSMSVIGFGRSGRPS